MSRKFNLLSLPTSIVNCNLVCNCNLVYKELKIIRVSNVFRWKCENDDIRYRHICSKIMDVLVNSRWQFLPNPALPCQQ